MPRYKLTLEYDGTPFCGWQRQADCLSVQGQVERALGALEPGPISVIGAGRTDAGVHATGQVAHVDLTREWEPFRLGEALNWHLKPDPVAVLAVERVDGDFHARFSATRRHYLYRILVRRAPAVLSRHRVWRVPGPLNLDAMTEAGQMLVGRHDFTTFRSAQCQAQSPVKTLDRVDVLEAGEEVHLHLNARSFLHNQVRSIAGTLERVGSGAWTAGRVSAALAARNRSACGPVAPPAGLYLTRVDYAGLHNLPEND